MPLGCGRRAWALSLGQGGLCVLLQGAPGWALTLKLMLLSLGFVFPPLSVLSQTERAPCMVTPEWVQSSLITSAQEWLCTR